MQPLPDLLHRIMWDPAFGRGEFALGYVDRVAAKEIVVPFSSVALDPGGGSFRLHDDDEDVAAHIPLHRVRTVYRNGAVIWQRPARPPSDRDGQHEPDLAG
jgi:uncharacterized protein (UPF0248 family)